MACCASQPTLLTAAGEDASQGKRWAWLEHRRDAEGHAPGDPDYDATTLLVPQVPSSAVHPIPVL